MDEKLYKDIEKNINICADKIFKFSPQLFILESELEPIMPSALATSILYEKSNNFYLITASHVFKNHNPKKIGLLINDVFSYLNGFVILTEDPNNKIDLAIMKLSIGFEKFIMEEYTFLDDRYIDQKHIFDYKLNYLMAGYPVHMSKYYKQTHKREQLILLLHPSKKNLYKNLLLDKKFHIIMDLENTRSFNNINYNSVHPKLNGMSGSGLWYIPSLDENTFKLVGIMIEWHKVHKVSVATRIDLVLHYIDNEIEQLYKKLTKIKPNKY